MTNLEQHTAALIQLHEMMANGQGDSDEADSIRDEMDVLDRNASLPDREFVTGLSGDLYLIHGEEAYRKTTDEEKPQKRMELLRMIDEHEWAKALNLLRDSLGYTDVEVAEYRGMIWDNIDPKVGRLFHQFALTRG